MCPAGMPQETIPDKFQGRVFGLIGLVTMLVPVALGAFGPGVDRFAPHVLSPDMPGEMVPSAY